MNKIFNNTVRLKESSIYIASSIDSVLREFISQKYEDMVYIPTYSSSFITLKSKFGSGKVERTFVNWGQHEDKPSTRTINVYKIVIKDIPIDFVILDGYYYVVCSKKDFPKVIKILKDYGPQYADQYETMFQDFDEIILNTDVKLQVRDIIKQYTRTFEVRQSIGFHKRMTIILSGKPGDGKTHLATKLAGLLSNFTGFDVVKDESLIFQKAAKLQRNFIGILDDVNQAHFSRKGEFKDICANILSEMDRPNCDRFFIMTTNEEINRNSIDEAFFRPGRIEAIIDFNRPSESTRRQYFEQCLSQDILDKLKCKIPQKEISGLIDLLVKETEDDFSYAQLNNIKDNIYCSWLEYEKFDVGYAIRNLQNVERYLESVKKNKNSFTPSDIDMDDWDDDPFDILD